MPDFAGTAKNARPLDGSTLRQKTLGGAASMLDCVKLRSDGKVVKTAETSDDIYGIIVSLSNKETSGVAGDDAGIVVFGPVAGFTGLTPSQIGYLSGTDGKLADSGTVAAGYAESETVFFVMPGVANVGS